MAITRSVESIQVVLVDKDDKVLGLKEKYAAHKNPVPLHRAISIVIFNNAKTEMLIAKRSKRKPTWPSFWSNTVCSHPLPNETYQEAADRRLFEEVGFRTPLKKLFKFTYQAKMDETWGEHELDTVFAGQYEGRINPNPDEIDGYEWVGIKTLKEDARKNPIKYTPWFKVILEKL
jgi:isopentenyl-diphosphate delta-isomerase